MIPPWRRLSPVEAQSGLDQQAALARNGLTRDIAGGQPTRKPEVILSRHHGERAGLSKAYNALDLLGKGNRGMKGVQYLIDDAGERTAVVIDLKRNRALWEDFYDRALAEARRGEPRESLASVRRRLARRNGRQSRGY